MKRDITNALMITLYFAAAGVCNDIGIMTSQVGYDIGDPMRAVIRSSRADSLPGNAAFTVCDSKEQPVLKGRDTQRSLFAIFLGNVTATHQFRAIPFGLQTSHQRLNVCIEVFLVFLRRYFIHTTGGTLVQILPAGVQKRLIQASVKILKPVFPLRFRLNGYSPQ